MVEFRTKYNPGDFSDNEYYEPGTSLTEPGQAESMQDLVARMSKAELVQRLAKKNQIVGDATKLQDAQIDALMSDSDLDEVETEKTEMAEALEAHMVMSELLAGAGANSSSGSEDERKPDIAKAKTSETQENSQTPATGFATESPNTIQS